MILELYLIGFWCSFFLFLVLDTYETRKEEGVWRFFNVEMVFVALFVSTLSWLSFIGLILDYFENRKND